MKKLLVVALALILALPVVSFAGSATSRWDMTIGGYVKFDVGWMDKGYGADITVAFPDDLSGEETLTNEYGNLYWAGGETRLNFLIKGPDAWNGAKTSAFIEGDFRGLSSGYRGKGSGDAFNTSYGTFTLRHAFMKFNWKNDELLLGRTWQIFGLLPSFDMVGFMENHFNKGNRSEQVRWTHNFNKNWMMQLAAGNPSQSLAGSGGADYVNDDNRSYMPDMQALVQWSTDKCGKVGRWPLLINVSGLYGKNKYTKSCVGEGCAVNDDSEKRWGFSVAGYIPIIPEKKGNKAGALGFTGNWVTGQGLGLYLPYALGIYERNGDMDDPQYPNLTAWWAQLTYYFTNDIYTNVIYGQQNNRISHRRANTTGDLIERNQNFIVNVMYNVNPAVKLGLEYMHVTTSWSYAKNIPTSGCVKDHGSANTVRFGAWYFF